MDQMTNEPNGSANIEYLYLKNQRQSAGILMILALAFSLILSLFE
jgi:hypothetical protein